MAPSEIDSTRQPASGASPWTARTCPARLALHPRAVAVSNVTATKICLDVGEKLPRKLALIWPNKAVQEFVQLML